MLLWTKIKQKNFQICIDHAPSCVHFGKEMYARRGVVAVHFLLQSQLSGRYRQTNLQGFDIRQQTAPLKHDRSQSHVCHTPPELPFLQIAIYFAQTTQPFFAL